MKRLLILATCLCFNSLTADAQCDEYKEAHRSWLHTQISHCESFLALFADIDTNEAELARFYTSGKIIAYYESLFFLDGQTMTITE